MEFLHFLCTIPVIIVFLIIYDMSPSLSWLWGIPLIGLGQMILTYGLALILSTLNLFFRDLERFISLGIMLMFYCTPILYSVDLIPAEYHWLIDANPLSLMILSWRDLFMHGVIDYGNILHLYFYSFTTLLIGVWVFNKLKFRFAEIL